MPSIIKLLVWKSSAKQSVIVLGEWEPVDHQSFRFASKCGPTSDGLKPPADFFEAYKVFVQISRWTHRRADIAKSDVERADEDAAISRYDPL